MSYSPEDMKSLIRSVGGCGEVSPNNLWICIKEPDHDGAHGDERWQEDRVIYTNGMTYHEWWDSLTDKERQEHTNARFA